MPYHIVQKDNQFCVAPEGEETPIDGGCHEREADAEEHMAALYANVEDAAKHLFPKSGAAGTVPAAESDDTLITYGGAVKALGQGRVGGYLVTFTKAGDYDLEADRFDKAESDLGEAARLPVLYQHGLDAKMKRKRIGTGDTRKDEVGMWIESQLSLRDAYEKAIYDLAEQGKLSWSSGAAAHTVERKPEGKGALITQWFISEASLTPTPAEPRNLAQPLKSLKTLELPLPDALPDGNSPGDAAAAPEAATDSPQSNRKQAGQTPATHEANEMTEEEKQALLDAIKASTAEATAAAIAEAVKPLNAQLTALQNAPPLTPAGGMKTNGAPAFNKTPRGDNAYKALGWYLKTGDASGIRTGEAYENFLKTDYHLIEGTQYQGQEAVPTEVYAGIVEKRDALSFARAGNAQVYQAGSNALVIPIEKANPQAWGITAADAATASTTLTQQPLDKLAGTVYLFTYNLPFHVTLLDDAAFDIEGWGQRYVARGLAITENTYMTMGTGSGQPQGAIHGSTLGVTAAAAAAVTAAEVAQVYYKIPAEYQDNVVWAMLTATHGAVRALGNPTNGFAFVGNGGYSGGAGTGSAVPNAGWLVDPRSRVFTPPGVDALAASKKPIFVGNLNAGYAIIDRQALTVLRDPYSEASLGNVNIWFYARFTAGVVNADSLYHIATPSA
jgi:HK97 family phage major capsid protein